jgi:hypothetical protein
VPYGHFFRPPVEVSLFCPAGHLPDAFVSGFPAPGLGEMAAVATPLAASAMAAANSAMRFFTAHPPVGRHWTSKVGRLGPHLGSDTKFGERGGQDQRAVHDMPLSGHNLGRRDTALGLIQKTPSPPSSVRPQCCSFRLLAAVVA